MLPPKQKYHMRKIKDDSPIELHRRLIQLMNRQVEHWLNENRELSIEDLVELAKSVKEIRNLKPEEYESNTETDVEEANVLSIKDKLAEMIDRRVKG